MNKVTFNNIYDFETYCNYITTAMLPFNKWQKVKLLLIKLEEHEFPFELNESFETALESIW